MTISSLDLGDSLALLHALSTRMASRDGDEIRACIQRIAELVEPTGVAQSDAALRERAAAELEHLVGAIGRLAGLAGAGAGALQGVDVGALVDQLRAFASHLRTPTAVTRAQIRDLIAGLPDDSEPQSPPSARDRWIESLALEAARARGLAGNELHEVVQLACHALALPVRQIEFAAQHDAARAEIAARLDPLLDTVIASGSALGAALAEQRAEIARGFRSIDLAHMASGLRVLSTWLATPAPDTAGHIAQLREQLAEALGPPTLSDLAAGEADRRAQVAREVAAAVDRAVRERTLHSAP